MNHKHKIALGITVIVFGPLFVLLCSGFADGISRSQLAPLRAVVGKTTFEQWMQDQPTDKHYYGRDRLAPDFELVDYQGQTWKLSEHQGKKILLNFWTITCEPCLEELPSLERLATLMKEQGENIEVVGICTDPNWQSVQHLFQSKPNMTVLFDPEKKVVHEKFGTELFPETWLIDEKGVIRFRYDGALDWASPVVRDTLKSL